jgi:hypothetical protein
MHPQAPISHRVRVRPRVPSQKYTQYRTAGSWKARAEEPRPPEPGCSCQFRVWRIVGVWAWEVGCTQRGFERVLRYEERGA